MKFIDNGKVVLDMPVEGPNEPIQLKVFPDPFCTEGSWIWEIRGGGVVRKVNVGPFVVAIYWDWPAIGNAISAVIGYSNWEGTWGD